MIAIKPSTEMPLADYFQTVYLRRRQLRDNSAHQYGVAVACINRWSGDTIRLADLCDDLVNDWIAWLCAGKMAPATARNRRRHILTLWRAASEDHLAPEQQHRARVVDAPWIPPKAWAFEEVRALLTAADRLKGWYPAARWPVSRRHPEQMTKAAFWGLLVRLAWDTGLRSGDIFALKAAELGAAGVIEVVQSKTRRWMMAKVHPETLATIRASFPPKREFIVPSLLTPNWFGCEFRALVRLAGISRGSFKRLRKSSATDVERRYPGMGSQHLGHAAAGGIARTNYLDPTLLIDHKPMPRPLRELTDGPPAVEKKRKARSERKPLRRQQDLAAILRTAAARTGITGKSLGKRIGVSQAAASRFLRGGNIKLGTASSLAEFLDFEFGHYGSDMAETLRAAIGASGMPAAELARQTRIDQTTISDFLRGSDMTLSRASLIAGVMGVELRRAQR